MKYKLLVLDLDGTLTNQKKEVTEHTRRTLIEAQERGVKVFWHRGVPHTVWLTGRDFRVAEIRRLYTFV